LQVSWYRINVTTSSGGLLKHAGHVVDKQVAQPCGKSRCKKWLTKTLMTNKKFSPLFTTFNKSKLSSAIDTANLPSGNIFQVQTRRLLYK
jgi:hypothetical protein